MRYGVVGHVESKVLAFGFKGSCVVVHADFVGVVPLFALAAGVVFVLDFGMSLVTVF